MAVSARSLRQSPATWRRCCSGWALPRPSRRPRKRMAEVRMLTVATAEDGVRLDRWFRRRWPHLSFVQIQKLARSGQIRVDGARARAETRLTAGALVRVPPLPDAPPAD